jgi:hypothetical protein
VLSCVWVCALLILLLLEGFGTFGRVHFHLDEKVLITALVSTIANIWGIILVVAKYLFPPRSSGQTKKNGRPQNE